MSRYYDCAERNHCQNFHMDHCDGCGNFETYERAKRACNEYMKKDVDLTRLITKNVLDSVYGAHASNIPFYMKIKSVRFNPPATIVFWEDGTKTVVKAEGEKFDPEKGLAMAITKKALGNKGNYYETIKKWVGEYEKSIGPKKKWAIKFWQRNAEGNVVGNPDGNIRSFKYSYRQTAVRAARKMFAPDMIPKGHTINWVIIECDE